MIVALALAGGALQLLTKVGIGRDQLGRVGRAARHEADRRALDLSNRINDLAAATGVSSDEARTVVLDSLAGRLNLARIGVLTEMAEDWAP